ncbi:hypothetical protein DPMN_164222 [Dreissena polymorpha]|uniref:Uncharacterized protein n=1 Tax=Dreissena polymorpha TaxID=45954 RepID=A0A9D4EY49_DREPO|nr:hypothetical protein DPMN_164222 [Dreissena polymorpha]
MAKTKDLTAYRQKHYSTRSTARDGNKKKFQLIVKRDISPKLSNNGDLSSCSNN